MVSVFQAAIVFHLCLYLLEDSLAPTNCFRLLSLSRLLGLPVLQVAAAGLALRSFSQTAAADAEGLKQLDLETLLSLLTTPELQVTSLFTVGDD